jgi:hypothetical protein
MKSESQIDKTLHLVGNAPPPSGLDKRVDARLRAARRPSFRAIRSISIVAAVAASIAGATIALTPGLRELALQDLHLHRRAVAPALPALVRPAGGFGAASAVHVPVTAVPVEPTPVTQGRGHSRSGRVLLPNGTRAPLPHGVAVPARAHIPPSTAPAPQQ